MKKYELIREINNMCRGEMESNITEIETDDLDVYMKEHISKAASCEKTVLDNGSVIYDVITNGLKEKYTFSEIRYFFKIPLMPPDVPKEHSEVFLFYRKL